MRDLTSAELEAVSGGGPETPEPPAQGGREFGQHLREFIASLLDQGGGQAVANFFKTTGTGM
jgi:hypothetical protein